MNVATRAWMQELQGLCKRHDMLLIVDDIQVGCGRTGNFFSFDEMDIQPDIITLSKSLSGFGLPMSLVLIKPELDQWKPGAHSGTFRGNNLAFVTAASTLDHYWSDDRFKQQIQAKAALVGDWLENIVQSYPDAGLSTRGRGLIQALVTPHRSGLAAAISARCFEQGLVIETSGAHDEVLKLLPALTISKAELQQGLEIIESSVAYALMHQSRKKVVKIAGARK